jgi:hypothetical protein
MDVRTSRINKRDRTHLCSCMLISQKRFVIFSFILFVTVQMDAKTNTKNVSNKKQRTPLIKKIIVK